MYILTNKKNKRKGYLQKEIILQEIRERIDRKSVEVILALGFYI